MPIIPHQYIDRKTRRAVTEDFFFDRTIQTLYTRVKEQAPVAYKLLLSARASALMGFMNYDRPMINKKRLPAYLMKTLTIDPADLYDPLDSLDTYRRIFERRIRFWDCRPMTACPFALVSPADARMIPGSFSRHSALFIKEKWFDYTELIGPEKEKWLSAFAQGDYAVFRLTPEKYHFNHVPVSGTVADIYEIDGIFHSCNPGAVACSVSPYSKNRRVVTVIDTDVPRGTGVGCVAMIEIVAMMIGRIVQCYSADRYQDPTPVRKGMFLKKGQPKSLFRPGSSTTVLVFEKDRVRINPDLVTNCARTDISSRFSDPSGRSLVETQVCVRETIAEKA